MLRLVGAGEGDVPVRRRAPLDEFDLERNEHMEVLAGLADSRLVTVGEGFVEVAHEALLREWPRLRGWIEEDAEGRRLRRHITRAANEWEASGRDPGELYRGARLAAALDWSAGHTLDLNQLERDFVAESREASERDVQRARRTNRRLRMLLAAAALLLAAAVVGGILALVQRGEARHAAAAQLAQRLGAQALVEEDLARSLLLARQAVAVDDTPQTRGYLLAALRRSPAAIGIMHGNGEVLRGIAISPDGDTLAVASGDGTILFFATRTDARIGKPLAGPPGESSLAYSPDGRTLAVVGDDSLRLIDVRTRATVAEMVVDGGASVAFTKDGSNLVLLTQPPQTLGSADAQLTVRDAATLEPIGRPIQPKAFVGAYVGFWYAAPQFAVTPDDRSVLTASEDGVLASWDLRSGTRTRTWRIEAGTAPALALSPDGRTAAVGMKRGLQLVDLRSGVVRTATAEVAGSPNWVLFSPDGTMVVATNRDNTVTRWDVASATSLETLRGHSNFVQQPAFSPDGETLYTVSHDGTAIAWDLTGDRRLGRPFTFTDDRTFSRTGYDGHPGAISPDGRLLAVGVKDRGIALWSARELSPVGGPLLGTGGEVKTLAFSPDGGTLAAVTQRDLTLWDVGSRSRLHGPVDAGEPAIVLAVGFSPDGKTVATASSNRGLQLWDAATGEKLDAIGGRSASGVSFSADGAMVAFSPDQGGAEVWDVATDTLIAAFAGSSEALDLDSSVALSPDGHLVAVGGFGKVVRLWDVRTGRLVHELDQGGNGAFTLEFTPDGRTLAISGFEPVASLWDVATGTQVGPQLSAGDRRTMIDLSSDGRVLLETHGNGKGAVWDVDPESWKRRACDLANRALTRAEWEELLPGRPYEPACM
jgi:WD40 repeat protein